MKMLRGDPVKGGAIRRKLKPRKINTYPWPPFTIRSLLANMGDAAQPLAVEHLLASAAPPDQCFWYAHPWGEQDDEQEKHTAELSNGPTSCSIPLTADYAKEVRTFSSLLTEVLRAGSQSVGSHLVVLRGTGQYFPRVSHDRRRTAQRQCRSLSGIVPGSLLPSTPKTHTSHHG